MLKFLSGLFGAGGITGLLQFAPWIIAGVVALAGAGGWFYQSHQVDAAKVETAKVALERDAAYTKIGTLQGALATDEATIRAQTDNIAANDELIAKYQHQADEDARASVEAGNQIRNLQNANPDVAAYLAVPIPCGLRPILNRSKAPQPATSAGGANENGCAVGAEAKPLPAPAR
jgi:hypothetical protein